MRTRMWLAAAAVAAGLVVGGCNSQKKTDTAEANPPATGGDAMPTVLSTPAQQVTPPPATSGHASAMAMSPTSGGGRTHMVQAKETLWSIAKQEYGDGKKWQDIAKANGNLDPSKLRVGQVLTLP